MSLSIRQSGTGQPLLLIHGLLVNGGMFDPLIPLLERRHHLLVPDLRGHGSSQHQPPPYSTHQHAIDLVRILDVLGFERTDVLGYSQGGAVAQEFARSFPQRIGRLILVCTYACNFATMRERLEGWLMPWAIRLLGIRQLADALANSASELTHEQSMNLRAMIAANGRTQSLGAIRALQAFDSRPWLDQITCPALIVAGSEDSAVPIYHAQMLRDGIKGAKLEVISGARHTLIWTHPQELANAVERFTTVDEGRTA